MKTGSSHQSATDKMFDTAIRLSLSVLAGFGSGHSARADASALLDMVRDAEIARGFAIASRHGLAGKANAFAAAYRYAVRKLQWFALLRQIASDMNRPAVELAHQTAADAIDGLRAGKKGTVTP